MHSERQSKDLGIILAVQKQEKLLAVFVLTCLYKSTVGFCCFLGGCVFVVVVVVVCFVLLLFFLLFYIDNNIFKTRMMLLISLCAALCPLRMLG